MDRRFIAKARLISSFEEEDINDVIDKEPETTVPENSLINQVSICPSARRVQVNQSPTVKMFYKHFLLTVTLDTGAELNMIKEAAAQKIGAPIVKINQVALQADGKSPL